MFFISIFMFLVFAIIGLALAVACRRRKLTEWYENGSKQSEEYIEMGVAHGRSTLWYENGTKMLEGKYVFGAREGLWTTWSQEGKKISETMFEDGKEVSKKTFD